MAPAIGLRVEGRTKRLRHLDLLANGSRPSPSSTRQLPKNVLTVRVSTELQHRLDAIADAIDRPRSWVVNRALETFVESEAWQMEGLKRGLAEADAGEFATDAEVRAMFEKWRRVDPDAD